MPVAYDQRRATLLVVLIATVWSFATSARGSLVRTIPFEEKVEKASAIIVGTCMRRESRWDESHRLILTNFTIRVEQVLKGNALSEITVVLPGGRLDGLRQETIGVPELRDGRDYVLFLRNTAQGITISYFQQGAYEIAVENGTRYALPFSAGATVVDAQRGTVEPAEPVRTLPEFTGAVHAAQLHKDRMNVGPETRRPPSGWEIVKHNKLLIGIAIVGAALAIWSLLRR
jgi:hypothetical protein